MLDYLVLALTHGLLAIAIWRLLQRPDLDEDPAAAQDDAAAPEPPVKTGPRIHAVRAKPSAPTKMKLPPRA